MIILDTNVSSALMQQQPDAQVVAWLDEQPAESVWLNSITLFDANCGLALLASGQGGSLLQDRVVPFDANAALEAAQLAADRKARGCPVDMRDTFIAGIALAQRVMLVTRNLGHFEDLSTPVVNPWGQK